MSRNEASGSPGRLADRRLLLTGAASGIGQAAARIIGEAGAKLALLDVDADGLRNTAAILDEGSLLLDVDLSDGEAAAAATLRAIDGLGGLDGIVNCAGVRASATLDQLDPELWRRVMAINLDAPYRICRAAVSALRQGRDATIVNVASAMALLPNRPATSAYAASKAGLVGFGKALAAELAPAIRVNTVCPGMVGTPMTQDIRESAPERIEHMLRDYALGRMIAPEEIAAVLLFLSSVESSSITGAVIAADGGRSFH